MADLAVGLSKTALEGLLNKVKTSIKEEAEQWQIVQRDLVFITGEFEMMQSFLDAADGERIKNHVVRTWVRQVRDLSYDVEDCIEFILHLDTRQSWWLRLLPSFKAGEARPLDEAVAEIKQLKARVEDVSQRNIRYNLFSDSSSKPDVQILHMTASSTRTLDILTKARDTAKEQSGFSELSRLITMDDKDLQVISVCGTGVDIRMISTIRKAYDDSRIYDNFILRAWVKLIHPFNPHEFIRSVLSQFYANTLQRMKNNGLGETPENIGVHMLMSMESKQGELIKDFVENVSSYTYLIILEDLSTMVQWDAIKMYLPDKKNGSRIIVSTHQVEIASVCTGQPYRVSKLGQISDDPSVCVFFKEPSQRDGGPSAEREVVRHWVENVLRVGHNLEADKLDEQITCYRGKSHVVSVLGIADTKTSSLVRTVYYRHVLMQTFYKYAWVEVRDWFELEHFSKFLILELQSEPIAADTIQECRKLLHEYCCLVVIEGLQSKKLWDSINTKLISGSSRSCIVVVTTEASVSTHCAVADDAVCSVKGLEAGVGLDLFRKRLFRGLSHWDATSFEREAACHWLDNLVLFGRDSELNKLLNLEAPIISVWGIPGVGKSALVRNVYYHHILRSFSPTYSWVRVPHPFNLMDFCRCLILDLEPDPEPTSLQVEDPIEKCRDLLDQRGCLVVIDGLQSKEDWDLIKAMLISGSSDGSIIVVTTEESVARHCAVTEDAVYNIKALEADAALHLFIDKVTTEIDMDWEARRILYKCGRLPKVIVVLASYLATRSTGTCESDLRRLNANFMHELETNPELYCLQGLLGWMHSYFHARPRSLKSCMLYVSIFPQDKIIRRRRLVRRWIADGYSKGNDSNSLEEYAEKLFHDLAAMSMMQLAPLTSTVTGYHVNGFFREYIVSRPMEEKIFFPIEVSVLEEGHYSLTTERIGQHLAIGSSWARDPIVFDSLDLSRLRSLTVFGKWQSFFISDKMRVLRVLDLEDVSGVTDYDLERIGKLLPRLKFLSLRGCTTVSRLPDSLGGLRQLQTLDIRHTSIITLPPTIIKLQKLQYIRAGTAIPWMNDYGMMAEEPSTPSSSRPHTRVSCLPEFHWQRPIGGVHNGIKVPRGIGRLTALHTLGVVSVYTAGAFLDEFHNLKKLNKLQLTGITFRNSMRLCIALLKCQDHCLQSLSLGLEKDSHDVDCRYICPPVSLRSLKMYGHVKNLPTGIYTLENLTKLSLEMTTLLTQENIKCIGSLEKLNTLRLHFKTSEDGELQFCTGQFDSQFCELKVLEIGCSSSLHVGFDDRAVKKLEQLKVYFCSGSTMQFSGLQYPISLKQVSARGYFGDAVKQALLQQLTEHPRKPILKMEESRSF